jgi:hypothetical protein
VAKAKKQPGRNPNMLPAESARRVRDLLEQIYQANGENGAVTGDLIGISGSAVSQIRSGKTRQISIATAADIARVLGKTLHIGISGDEPPEGMRTIGSDPNSAAALAAAREQYDIKPWIVAVLLRTPIPENWPSLTPEVCLDLASVWEKWEGRLGSRVRQKAVRVQ